LFGFIQGDLSFRNEAANNSKCNGEK